MRGRGSLLAAIAAISFASAGCTGDNPAYENADSATSARDTTATAWTPPDMLVVDLLPEPDLDSPRYRPKPDMTCIAYAPPVECLFDSDCCAPLKCRWYAPGKYNGCADGQ